MKEYFPILSSRVNGSPLIYYDNAATLQMAAPVQEAVAEHYRTCNGNVHRSSHAMARNTEERMEAARETVQAFLGAEHPEEIIFTSGTTQSINLLSRIYEDQLLQPGDEIIVTALEHNSNFLTWLEVCRRTGALLRVVPMKPEGDLDLEAYEQLLTNRTRLVCVTWISNAIGTVNPVEQMAALAHRVGAKVLVDGAQAVLHRPVDVTRMGCDYFAFSGHKLGALTGIGVLYGRQELLERLHPPFFGGGMIAALKDLHPEYAPLPYRFEAGTPNYVGAISLGAAIRFLNRFGIQSLADRAESVLNQIRSILLDHGGRIVGHPQVQAGVLSVLFSGVHAYDLACTLDQFGVAVRAGHHCASYGLSQLGVSETLRISPAFYNEPDELAQFEEALERSLYLLRR